MEISFKFSIFDLKIEHRLFKELGEFTVFCMKAINEHVSLSDISNIIQLEEELIKKQLAFLVSRRYLNNDYSLSQKGIEVIELFQFINTFNKSEAKIALEQYIENNSKKIYSANNAYFEEQQRGYLIKDNFFDYKLQTKFDEIIKDDKNKIKPFLLGWFSGYEDVVDKHIDSFVFNLQKREEQFFYNYAIADDTFVDMFEDKRAENRNYIAIEIPIIEVRKVASSETLDKKNIDAIQKKFDEARYFNLINGQSASYINQNIKKINLSVESIIEENDIAKLQTLKNLSVNELIFIDLKTDIQELKETKFFDITNILEKL